MIKFASLAACAVLAAALLSGCTEQSLVVDGSTVTIASSQATTSLNDRTTFGNTPANAAVVAAAGSGFTYYNADRELVRDESFGEFEIVSNEPFSVRYTVNEGVTWSDGVAVDAADLLLAWAANSGVFTTEGFEPARFIDRETGQFTEFPDDAVYFDGATKSGLQHVSEVPELGDDGRSITLTYDEYFPDWELALVVGPAAHVVVEQARTVRGTEAESKHAKAKRLLIEAVQDAEASSLAPIAAAWNSAFNLVEGSIDDELLVTDHRDLGAQRLTDHRGAQLLDHRGEVRSGSMREEQMRQGVRCQGEEDIFSCCCPRYTSSSYVGGRVPRGGNLEPKPGTGTPGRDKQDSWETEQGRFGNGDIRKGKLSDDHSMGWDEGMGLQLPGRRACNRAVHFVSFFLPSLPLDLDAARRTAHPSIGIN